MAKKKREQRRAPQREAPPVVDLDFQEVPDGEEGKEPEPVVQEKLFTWKGKDYFIEKPDATLMLELLESASERGDMGAVGTMLKRVIGPENYRVLKNIPDLSNAELNAVIERAMYFTLGQMEDVLGNT